MKRKTIAHLSPKEMMVDIKRRHSKSGVQKFNGKCDACGSEMEKIRDAYGNTLGTIFQCTNPKCKKRHHVLYWEE